jgi:riboflavin transporter FmnP
MLALLLYLWLGPRAAFAELLAELVIGLALLGGGHGKLVGATLRLLLARLLTRARGRRVAPA